MIPLSTLFFLIEMCTDMIKIRKFLRRPWAKFKLNIGRWNVVMKFFTIASIFVAG